MARKYTHMKDYEEEIVKLRAKGYTNKQIGKRYGVSAKQVHDCITRMNKRKKRIAQGQPTKKRGRPSRYEGELPPSIQKLDKLSQMRYAMASKDRYIKRLEMELELMRDFLSLTERK